MDRQNINNNSNLTSTFHIDSNDTNPNNKEDIGAFNDKTVSQVPAITYDDYLFDEDFDNNISNRVIKASEKDVAMPSIKDASNFKLTDLQIDKQVIKMIRSCKHGRSIVIYYTDAQTSAMLLWDPVKRKPVYTTFNQQGVVVDSSEDLNALRQDIQMYSDSRYENLKVKLKGLDTQAVLNKIKEGNNRSFDPQNNNSAQYIAGLLKASFPHEHFVNDTAEQMSINTNIVAYTKFTRKYTEEINVESALHMSYKYKDSAHGVLVNGIKRINHNGNKYVALKLHTTGRKLHIKMKERTFHKNFFTNDDHLLASAVDSREYETLIPLSNTAITGGNNGLILCHNGEKYYNRR